MSGSLRAEAEILKLARVLRRDPAELGYLEQVAPDDIRQLREQVTEVLFTAHGAALSRLAAGSRVLPVGVVATIGQRAFGPVLSARIAGLLEPGRAAATAERMPVDFLADIAIELDPRRASAVISRIPPDRIAEITRELVRRQEYVTMGRFVGHLGDGAIRAAIAAMDDATVLRVAFVLEANDGLDGLVEMLPPERLGAVVDTASREHLWVEVLDLLANLSEDRRIELADKAGERGEDALEEIVRAAAERGLWLELLPLVDSLSPRARRRVAAEASRLDPAQRDAMAADARAAGLGAQVELLERAAG